MAAASARTGLMLLMAVALSSSSLAAAGTLRYDFYKDKCPQAEGVVRSATQKLVASDPTIGAALVRLFFHDCFVRGCDASILLNPSNSNPQPEKLAIPLRGYDAVNTIKAAVEDVCPGVVSCADILAFASRDTAAINGGFTFSMPGGRRDGFTSVFSDVFGIPAPFMQVQELIQSFAGKNLTVDDLVALSGAHSFGITHCSFVTPRLYPTVDPTMNVTFANNLKNVCPPPRNGGGGRVLNLNNVTDPNRLNNQFYSNVLTGQVMFRSDQTLTSSGETAKLVKDNAAKPVAWMARFAAALVKMGGIEVLTGDAGEVRKVCGSTNSGN